MEKNRLFICLLFLVIVVGCRSNNSSDFIFEFKDSLLQNEGWTVTINSKMQIDSTEKVDGKYPLVIVQTKDTFLSRELPISVIFYREILLPEFTEESMRMGTISVTNKSLNLNQALVKFFGIDKEDNIIFCDSININNENIWNTKLVSFPLKEIQKIILGVYAFGYDYPSSKALKSQRLWLDKITFHFDNELLDTDKSQFTIREQIDSKHLIEINTPFDLNKINIPDDKTIIGIGEAVHGSKTINQLELGLVKKLILHNSCRLVLFELNMFQLMLWNQYIQGKLPGDYISIIKKELLSTLFSPEEVGEFLVWLREYNSSTKEKVNIQGVVPFKYGWGNQLFHYLHTFYTSSTMSTIAPLLKKLSLKTLSEALNYAKELRSSLKTVMGNREYVMFLYALEKAVNNNVIDKNPINPYYQFLYRDIPMAENVSQFISLYLQDNQKACIIAHNDHVNKKLSPSSFPSLYPMGYYLHQKYRNKYYVLGIFPGEGSIFVGTDNNWAEECHLESILPNSLEYFCIQTRLAAFFYPTSYLGNGLSYYRSIGNKHIVNEYESGNLRIQMDGIIFINKVHPIHTSIYDVNEGNIVPELFMKEFKILKDIKKETIQ